MGKSKFILAVLIVSWIQAASQEIILSKEKARQVQLLTTSWEFVWDKLLTPVDFSKGLRGTQIVQLPHSWKDDNHPHSGVGTYRVTIHFPQKKTNYSILFPIINSSAKVWVNGSLVDSVGVCTNDLKRYRGRFGSMLIAVPPDTTAMEIVVQVANFSYTYGGIVRAPRFAPTPLLIHEQNNRKGVENFFVGSLIAMFFYQIILFFLYKHGKPYLYLGLICLIVALRAMVTHGGSFLLLDLFPDVQVELWKKLEFFAVYAVVAIFPLYSFYLFHDHAYRKPIPIFVSLSAVLCSIVIFTPQEVYYKVLDVCHILLICGFGYTVAVITKAWRAGNRDARIILFGVLASFPFILLEIAQNTQIIYFRISFSYLVELGVLVFLLFQVYLLANHYAIAYKNLEQVNVDLEAKVKERTAELTKANHVKEKLLSVVSHDIKSPLNSLRGVLNVYRQGGFSDSEMKTLTGHIDENLNATTMLVDNILLWTSSQLKGVTVKLEKVDLKKLIDDHMKIFKTIAENKHISFDVSADGETVNSDKQILSLVLRNLIANAIKFSFENGQIMIKANHNESGTKIIVRDSGKGMAPEVAQALFTKSSVSTEGTSQEKGTGLGLALCYEYLKYIGGEISVQSELNKGTTFIVWCPKK
ncbi:MAG: sensor histidine kinase [Cyclobacteriaceae bacterium]